MTRRRGGGGALAPAAAGGLLVALALHLRARSAAGSAPSPATAPPTSGPPSARRLRALSFLASVLPAEYGAEGALGERFKLIAPGYEAHLGDDGKTVVQTDHGVVLPEHFTTCGYLPCAMGRALGLALEISQCGLEQLRTNALRWGAWVTAEECAAGRLPRPGDPYGIDQPAGGLVVHVGVVLDGSGPTWTTADAGQGSRLRQRADRVARAWDPAARTLGGPLGPRRLAGYCDLDRVPPLDGGAARA